MKNRMTRLLAVLLAATTMMGMLSGCGEKEENVQDDTNKESEEQDESAKKDESEEQDESKELEEYTITWYVAGNGPQADTDMVEDAIYEYLKDDLNVRVDFIESDFGSHGDKVQMAIASGEAFDLCWTASWSNNYLTNISKNAFLELDDLIEEYGQDLKAVIPEYGWDAATVNGNIYAVPSMQIWAYQGGIEVATKWLEEYDFDITTAESLKDMEPLFEAIKADHPDMYPIVNNGTGSTLLSSSQNTLGYEELVGQTLPGVLVYGDETLTVVNQYELPQVEEFLDMMYDWNQKGYFRSDAATVTDEVTDLQIEKSIAKFIATYKPGEEASAKANFGQDFTVQTVGTAHSSTSSIVATMNAISRTSENPERVMQFLNRVNTDPELYNLICFGIEGVHYTKEGNYAIPVENSGYNPNVDWVFGNQFNGLLREGQGENDWELTKEINESAEASLAMGFSFDSTSVQTELASVKAVVDEYYLTLATGSADPEQLLPEFIEKMKLAGSDKLIEECQKQLDAWVEANK